MSYKEAPKNYVESDEGEIIPSYAAGNGNQPVYPQGSYQDTEMPDFFHGDVPETAAIIDLTEARHDREVRNSKARHPGFGGGLPIDLTEIADTPIGGVDEKMAERGRHPTARVAETLIGEDPNDPVIIEWQKAREEALRRDSTSRLTIAQKNQNEAEHVARTRREFPG